MDINGALEVLDRAFDQNERVIQWNMDELKKLLKQLDELSGHTAELNKRQIEINNARKAILEDIRSK